MRQGWKLAVAAAVAILVPVTAGASPGDGKGFIYGTVESSGGKSYTGIIRWGKEEAFWGDFFNSAKEDLPYRDRQPRSERSRRSKLHLFGTDIGYKWTDGYGSRQFLARFGDISEIVPRGGERADVLMKSGTKYKVDGASNDIGAEITVQDASIGAVTIPWRRIEAIRFKQAPANLDPGVSRLYGSVKSEDFTFEGYIQWDSDECLSTDLLNGSTEDGRMAIEMGKIASIARNGRNRSDVILKDGRNLTMEGTNDVDHSIRGIFVEDARLGRVKVEWDSFDRLDFKAAPGSGKGYDEYKVGGPIRGRVTDADGKSHSGQIIFDLDESETWEFLTGNRYDVEFNITFDQLKSIEPRDRASSLVVLRNGADVVLEDSQDVSDRNDGVLILTGDDDRGTYIAWDEIRKIDFE